MNPAVASPVVSVRSRLANHSSFSSSGTRRIDVVCMDNGSLIKANNLTALQKLIYHGNDMFTVITERQRLVFRHTLNVHGWNVQAKLTMWISPDVASLGTIAKFVTSFYKNDMREITTGLLAVALRPYVEAAIMENLSFVTVYRVPLGSPIKNASRHERLSKVCASKGLHLFTDELVIESVC